MESGIWACLSKFFSHLNRFTYTVKLTINRPQLSERRGCRFYDQSDESEQLYGLGATRTSIDSKPRLGSGYQRIV